MRNIIVTFGIICLASLILMEMGKVAFIKNTLPVELLIGAFAAIFLVVGILIARKHPQPPPAPQINDATPSPAPIPDNNLPINYNKINELGISKREYEVLCEVALGLSNTEIADKIFVSESTVKTHISNLLMKLNAKRRTEAVRIAKELKIIN